MGNNNKVIVEKVNAAFAKGDTEVFLEHCLDNVVWNMVGEKTTKGVKAIREWMASMGGMEPPKFTVDTMIADGDFVACYGDMTMKNKTGSSEDYSYCDVYRFSGDKIAELRSFVVKHKTEPESGRKATA